MGAGPYSETVELGADDLEGQPDIKVPSAKPFDVLDWLCKKMFARPKQPNFNKVLGRCTVFSDGDPAAFLC